ncbi:hypothetical protein ACKFKF_20395 [Phormidesmis sp. 146-12]
MVLMLTIVKDTWLKISQAQSADLADNQKHFVAAGKQFALLDCHQEDNHLWIVLSQDAAQQFSGQSTWYAYVPDVQVSQDEEIFEPPRVAAMRKDTGTPSNNPVKPKPPKRKP